MLIDFDDITNRYLQLYLLEYPENQTKETGKDFLFKHLDEIKKELFERVGSYANKALNSGADNAEQEVEYAEISCMYAFDAFLKALKQR